MGYVLGIDAAWTATNPSGVALVSSGTSPPKLIRASPSFEDFVLGTDPGAWCAKHDFRASLQDVLKVAAKLGGASVEIIAVDMPIATKPVRRRRASDQMISKCFGGRGCSTHTPTELRPGKISDRLCQEALDGGFSLVTTTDQQPERALIEVYPHVAVLELCQAAYRVPYKLSRVRRYWPRATACERRDNLRKEWAKVIGCLQERIDFDLEIDCSGRQMRFWKAWEDVIDAIVCCWVGLEWLGGRARPYGDEISAIWVPERDID